MIPICLSPGDPSAGRDQKGIRLRAFPLSKRWVSLTVPLQSLPVSQEAPDKGLPLSPDRRERRKRNTTHIYEIIWHLMFRYNERKNCFSLRGVETCDTRKWFGAVTLLSERRSVFFWQEGYAVMLFRDWLDGERRRAVWRTIIRTIMVLSYCPHSQKM